MAPGLYDSCMSRDVNPRTGPHPAEGLDVAPADGDGRAAPMADALPPGTPIVHLRSASYGSFIYQRMVGRVEGGPADGDLVAVVDRAGRVFGWGFYNSRSQLALRMFTHQGEPPAKGEIAARVRQAVELRRGLLGLEQRTDAYRLVHSEGDGLSGLVADRLGPYVVIELFSLAMFRRLEMIQDAFVDAGLDVRGFVVRADTTIMRQEGFRLDQVAQAKAGETTITENGVRFHVDLQRGHKTGFFCDQRDNRLALAGLVGGKSVLDVCCYSGGFAIYAAALGRAAAVTGVDLDEAALALARRNAELNGLAVGGTAFPGRAAQTGKSVPPVVEFRHGDAFDFLRQARQLRRQWDVVVLDPSKFVPSRDMLEPGLRKYADLNRLACDAVAPGGLLLSCSCSGLVDQPTFVQTLARAARAAGRSLQIFRVAGAGPDHPFLADAPEAAYLKAVWARVL